jgi:hypothetical protein
MRHASVRDASAREAGRVRSGERDLVGRGAASHRAGRFARDAPERSGERGLGAVAEARREIADRRAFVPQRVSRDRATAAIAPSYA